MDPREKGQIVRRTREKSSVSKEGGAANLPLLSRRRSPLQAQQATDCRSGKTQATPGVIPSERTPGEQDSRLAESVRTGRLNK
mmetsp:Transcript_9628/g.29184  ORF Transcript_9628/g.29184 Transcript_9628/m.29184 type:complete len:83 (-) Transcript_9628:314-562(-)